jgi:hypothetical protein
MQKDAFFIPDMTHFEKKKNWTPFMSNLTFTRLTISSSWISDKEFKKIFLFFPEPPPTRYTLSFLISQKS